MQSITLVFSCDLHHTQQSMCLHGACSGRVEAIDMIEKLLNDTIHIAIYPPLTEQDKMNIVRIGQTQGYSGAGEWHTQTLVLEQIDCHL